MKKCPDCSCVVANQAFRGANCKHIFNDVMNSK